MILLFFSLSVVVPFRVFRVADLKQTDSFGDVGNHFGNYYCKDVSSTWNAEVDAFLVRCSHSRERRVAFFDLALISQKIDYELSYIL